MQLAYITTAEYHLCKRIILLDGIQQRSYGIFIKFLIVPKEVKYIKEILRKEIILQRLLLFRQRAPHSDGTLRVGAVDTFQQFRSVHIEKIFDFVLVLQLWELLHDPRHGRVFVVHGIDLFAAKPLPMFGEIP